MNQEIDDTEFYHEDFTTASDWEILVAHMEEIVNQWKTDEVKESGETPRESSKQWNVRSEKLVYVDTNFDFLWYKRILDEDLSEGCDDKAKHPLDKWHDFQIESYNSEGLKDICLASWYGLDEFLVLSPSGKHGVTNNESKAKILLSACLVLVNNLSLEIPIFIQVREKWQKMYLGVYEANGTRTNFDVVHLKRGLYYCQYLTGLLDLFKTKIMSPCMIENIFVSYQATYTLNDFGNFIWKQDLTTEAMDIENLFILPFGVTVDPVNALHLKTIWSYISEHSVIDSESHSDFDPLKAQKWHCSVQSTHEPVCLLGDALGEFLELLNKSNNVYDVLGDYATVHVQESNPLDLLTESSVPTISTLLSRAARNSLTKNKRGNPPIQEGVLVSLLYFLFPDADENSNFPYGKDDKEPLPKKLKIIQNFEEQFKGFKTCNEDSLIWRLSVVLCHTLQSLGGIKAFCHIWYEFVQEMRYRWEKGMMIPGVTPGIPDLRTCLLNQKLQMLNCCLERKITRDTIKYSSAENSDEDDEFFDASDDVEDEERRKEKFLPWDKPVGRFSKFGDMKLIKTGDPLYIPFTQDPVLKTEDQVQEDTDILVKLGSDQRASELRARIMSASLLSDMESFKAANPGSVVEDFIRWHSPRDWIEEDELDEFGQNKGHLSPRMQLNDNIWVEMWENARPVPASRQKRLFDDTREAEKVLQFLDFRTIGQIAELIIPVLSQVAICRLVDEIENLTCTIPDSEYRVTSLLKHGERISRDVTFQPKRFEVFTQEVTVLEMQISQVNSLQYKLNPQGMEDEVVNKLIGELASGKSINLEDKGESLIGSRIVSMFTESQRLISLSVNDQPDTGRNTENAFPAPTQKEFVLRTNCIRPSLYSAKSPQFLRAILEKGEFRLLGAFSEDVNFF
ncbi:rab3 GTPase-activating protein catalytic subunit [Anthonomus grandis grandis]|uniref:rab3 GTPase-activating protein catalytic subunit n=1 Tax=Anthonomus grandis grandis TaxID=2921223 RepID=UPI0021661925|nr:rab3 GTPase-activating protein catalytic subunit [Anthonomus grandis grandis]